MANGVLSKFQERLRRMRILRRRRMVFGEDKDEEKDIHVVVDKKSGNKRKISTRHVGNVLSDDNEKKELSDNKINVVEVKKSKDNDNEKKNKDIGNVFVNKNNDVVKDEDSNYKKVVDSKKVIDNKDNDKDRNNIKNNVLKEEKKNLKKGNVSSEKGISVDREKELEILEKDLILRIQLGFEDKLDDLEVLEGQLFLLFEEEKNALVIEQIRVLKKKISLFVEELNRIIDQYNAYKRNYYIDNVIDIDDSVIADDLVRYRMILDYKDDEKGFVGKFKKLEEFKRLYVGLNDVKGRVSELKDKVKEKDILFKERDGKYRDILNGMLDVNNINKSCNEEMERQNDYFESLMKDISDIKSERYITTHIKGLGDLASMSIRYLGLLMLSPLRGTIPGIGVQTLMARNMIVNMYNNIHVERVEHVRYYAKDFERDINDKLNDIDYTSLLIDDALEKIDSLSSDFMLQYQSNIPNYDDTLNKISKIRRVIVRNQNKINKIKNNFLKSKKVNEEKLIRVRELNEKH